MSDDESFDYAVASIRRQQPQQQLRRASLGPRVLLSPTPQNRLHFLGSNDDELERAELRAARAAANRRKSSVFARPISLGDDSGASPDVLGTEQVLELFQNCIKLASENKINQKNTWDLGLIDHLSEIIRVEPNNDAETNFQKASCTLEAGVKIYSMRVDSVHSEAYKVLGGINRVGKEDDKENVAEDESIDSIEENNVPKKDLGKKMSPESTLESSFEALNVKKFDVAFTVDPLYHQTSKQFDEGGVKGLLLSNLGVYGNCKVLFDSLEVPRKCMASDRTTETSEFIDLSFAKEQLKEMVDGVHSARDISPTLAEIINKFDENNKRPPNLSYEHMPTVEDDIGGNHEPEFEAEVQYDQQWNFDHDEQSSILDDEASYVNPTFTCHQEENYDETCQESGKDDRTEKIAGFLSLGLGFSSKANAWAGPDYWKYRKVKVTGEDAATTTLEKEKKTKSRKQSASTISFTKSLDVPPKDIFAPPKNPKSLLLSANQVPCNITLPEDVHYQPENLVKLFLVPNTLCMGKKTRKTSGDFKQHFSHEIHDTMGDWDDEGDANEYFDDGNIPADCDNLGDLVSQPRQVNKIEIEYDKFSKQVDVHALKGVLWKRIRDSIDGETECSTAVSFKQICSSLLNGSSESPSKDISLHLCFICVLHLANEHCLRICHQPTFDELDIYVTQSTKL